MSVGVDILTGCAVLALSCSTVAAGGSPAEPPAHQAAQEGIWAWLDQAYAYNARLIQIVKQLKQTGDVDTARDALEEQFGRTYPLIEGGEKYLEKADTLPPQDWERLCRYRLKLATQNGELHALINGTEQLRQFPGLILFINAMSAEFGRDCERRRADTHRRLKEYIPKACAAAQGMNDCLDRITDTATAAAEAPVYAELLHELIVYRGILVTYLSFDPEGAQRENLSKHLEEQMSRLDSAFRQKALRLEAAGYYGCAALRTLLAHVAERVHAEAK